MKFSLPFATRTYVLTFTSPIVGGIPANPALIEGWLKANMPEVQEDERQKLAETTLAEVASVVEQEAKGMHITFKHDEKGVYIEGRQVKAAFKECANILRETFQKQEAKGEKAKSRFTALRAKLAERLFVVEQTIYLMRDNTPLLKPDATEESAINVMTAQGPRTALKRYDLCKPGTQVRFTVKWLEDGIIDADLVDTLVEYMSLNGLGANRGQGFGTFTWSV